MKALIVSDNHYNLESLTELTTIYKDEIDLWLHCGDSEFTSKDPIWDTFKPVRGNMDSGYALPLDRLEDFGDEKILIVHGHNHRVGFSLDRLHQLALDQGADVVFYGHTHIAKVDKIDDIYFINPGSIVQPRGDLRIGSYAIYEKNNEGRFIQFYDWNHNEMKELSTVLN